MHKNAHYLVMMTIVTKLKWIYVIYKRTPLSYSEEFRLCFCPLNGCGVLEMSSLSYNKASQ